MIIYHFSTRTASPSSVLFNLSGEEQILLSPGVVDFAGVLIIPRENDFNRIERLLVEDIYSQLTLNDEAINDISQYLVN